MKLTLLQKILSLSVFTKATAFKKGSLMVLALPLSAGFLGSVKRLVKDVDMNDLVFPVLVAIIGLGLYFVAFIFDFFFGLMASKHEEKNNPDWIKSEKLYSSLGKIGGVILITIAMLLITLFLVVLKFSIVSVVFLVIMAFLLVLAFLYELHSIGENIKRRSGSKPKIFKFFDRMAIIIEDNLLKKIDKQTQ